MVDRDRVIDGSRIAAGDVLIGLPSAGLHTNGYSLARKILFERMGLPPSARLDGLEGTVAETLLAEHRSYLRPLEGLLDRGVIHALAHITGGGLTDNLPRVLPEGTAARIDVGSWRIPALFGLLERAGNVDDAEMYRTFNMGVGMVVVSAPDRAGEIEAHLDTMGEPHFRIGAIVPGDGRVHYA
jgi:phosphoribosylformylglycinamidine cyclo-ligase